ncbi:hypothetical protein TSUD_361610 [Trifolium subterraneum]|uniref:Uncharacterized protein n=1 Tax=Trifolium subterraneum TaxID=3900 RepID=A0A2Z6M5J1_TRISU|nr:hypothetical protein TSUD_361610 [Trifolium subterraneum]
MSNSGGRSNMEGVFYSWWIIRYLEEGVLKLKDNQLVKEDFLSQEDVVGGLNKFSNTMLTITGGADNRQSKSEIMGLAHKTSSWLDGGNGGKGVYIVTGREWFIAN